MRLPQTSDRVDLYLVKWSNQALSGIEMLMRSIGGYQLSGRRKNLIVIDHKMYLSHYNLQSKPFPERIDPANIWLTQSSGEALLHFEKCMEQNAGIMVLTGGVGAGKTSFAGRLLTPFPHNEVVIGNIVHSRFAITDFLHILANEFALDGEFADSQGFITLLKAALLAAVEKGQKAVLVIDEAQHLSQEILQVVQLMADLEEGGGKLLAILLVGQDDLNTLLAQPKNRDLQQKIALFHQLTPFTKSETEQYIQHFLKKEGGNINLFSVGAIEEVFGFSKGLPRLINLICDLALLKGAAEEAPIISKRIVRQSVLYLQLPHHKVEEQGRHKETAKKSKGQNEAERVKQRVKESRGPIGKIGKMLVFLATLIFLSCFLWPPVTEISELKDVDIELGQLIRQENRGAEVVADLQEEGFLSSVIVSAGDETVEPARDQKQPEILEADQLRVTDTTETEIGSGERRYLEKLELMVALEYSNLRDEPSNDGKIITVVRKGSIVKLVAKGRKWQRVELDGGRRGWIYGKLLSPAAKVSSQEKDGDLPFVTKKIPLKDEAAVERPSNSVSTVTSRPQKGREIKIDDSGPPSGIRQEAVAKIISASQKKRAGSKQQKNSKKSYDRTNNPFALQLAQKSYVSVKSGKYNFAIDEATQAINLDPGLIDPYINRARAYSEKGMDAEAIADFSVALSNRGWVYQSQGKLLMAQADYKKACENRFELACERLAEISKILQRSPAGETVEGRLDENKHDSVLLDFEKEFYEVEVKKAKTVYDKSSQRERLKIAQEWTAKSSKSLSLGNFEKAILEANKALFLNPDFAEPYVNRAWAYAELGFTEKALSDCNQALSLDPDNGLALNNLGYVYQKMGNEKKALTFYQKACERKTDIACENYKLLSGDLP